MDLDDEINQEVEESESNNESDEESNENDSDNEEIVCEEKGAKDQVEMEEDNGQDMSNQDELMLDLDSKLSEFFKHKKFEKKKKKGSC